jgi:nucleolar GTP-binding protein
MNFQDIPPIERSKHYLDMAFKKAREKSRKKLKGIWLDKVRTKEMIKLDVIKGELTSRLNKVIKSFPSLNHLPKFYIELLRLTLNHKELKKSLGGINWALEKMRFFQRNYVRKISKGRDAGKIKQLGREFYGRISSVIKQIDKQLVYLEESRKIMKNYPDVKEMPTVVIFGFPNVGKTTLLNKLTSSKGKVASYAFTTVRINSGFLKSKEKTIQVLDVPGTLARPEKMNDIEKIAYLAVKELADFVIYVFDLTEMVSLKKQEKLFKNLKRDYQNKILIYISKKDITEKEEIKEFQKRYKKTFDAEELKKEIGKLTN